MSERTNARVIEFNGVQYTCTLSDRFRRHTPEEQDAMRASLQANGVRVAVRLYRDIDLGLDNCVLDGEGRLSLAAELGLPAGKVPFYREPGMGTDDAYEQAKTLNDCRRHDDIEVIRRRRLERVAEKRAAGKSIRAIAEELDIDPKQVRRDLSTVSGGDTVPTSKPERVTGRDGKEYPATAPKTVAEELIQGFTEFADDLEREQEPEDRGDAWEPPDDEDAELIDDEGDEDIEPQDDTLPQPAIDASKPERPRGKPPKPLDKDHPFYDVLMKFAALNGAITKALRTDKGAALIEAFIEAQMGKHHLPFLYFTHGTIIGDECKPKTVKFVGLHAMRRLIRDVGTRKKKIPAGWAAKTYQNALEVARTGGGKPQ